MNRAMRRRAREPKKGGFCPHGYLRAIRTDAGHAGRPWCPHGCGAPHSQRKKASA